MKIPKIKPVIAQQQSLKALQRKRYALPIEAMRQGEKAVLYRSSFLSLA